MHVLYRYCRQQLRVSFHPFSPLPLSTYLNCTPCGSQKFIIYLASSKCLGFTQPRENKRGKRCMRQRGSHSHFNRLQLSNHFLALSSIREISGDELYSPKWPLSPSPFCFTPFFLKGGRVVINLTHLTNLLANLETSLIHKKSGISQTNIPFFEKSLKYLMSLH